MSSTRGSPNVLVWIGVIGSYAASWLYFKAAWPQLRAQNLNRRWSLREILGYTADTLLSAKEFGGLTANLSVRSFSNLLRERHVGGMGFRHRLDERCRTEGSDR